VRNSGQKTPFAGRKRDPWEGVVHDCRYRDGEKGLAHLKIIIFFENNKKLGGVTSRARIGGEVSRGKKCRPRDSSEQSAGKKKEKEAKEDAALLG